MCVEIAFPLHTNLVILYNNSLPTELKVSSGCFSKKSVFFCKYISKRVAVYKMTI